MSFRTLATIMILSLSNWQATSAQTKSHARTRATAKITAQSSEAKPYDQTASPALMEIRLSETFVGDIDGESAVRALQVLRDDHSADLVSVQRFRGKLDGREGTFVLQGQEVVENGKIKATWFVVPGSGTGDLPGYVAKAALKATLEKGQMDGWIIGLNEHEHHGAMGNRCIWSRKPVPRDQGDVDLIIGNSACDRLKE